MTISRDSILFSSNFHDVPAEERGEHRGRPPVNPNTVGNTQPASTENMVLNTAEQIVEKITNTTTPEASAGVLIDWSIQMLESALGLGGQAATADAVKEHVATLKANKAALATAVAATPAE